MGAGERSAAVQGVGALMEEQRRRHQHRREADRAQAHGAGASRAGGLLAARVERGRVDGSLGAEEDEEDQRGDPDHEAERDPDRAIGAAHGRFRLVRVLRSTPSSRRQFASKARSAAATAASSSSCVCDQRGEQLASLGGVLDVAAAVDREVARPGLLGDPVVAARGPPAWSPRSPAGRSRSRRGARARRARRRARSRPRRRRGLGVRPAAGRSADGVDEPVPESDVVVLLVGVPGELVVLGQPLGGVGGEVGDRLDGVPVLARVVGELLAGQLAGGPARVEGMGRGRRGGGGRLRCGPRRSRSRSSPRVFVGGRTSISGAPAAVCDPRGVLPGQKRHRAAPVPPGPDLDRRAGARSPSGSPPGARCSSTSSRSAS